MLGVCDMSCITNKMIFRGKEKASCIGSLLCNKEVLIWEVIRE